MGSLLQGTRYLRESRNQVKGASKRMYQNVMRNKQNHTNDQYSNSRNSKKHMDLLNVLKEREAVQAKHNSGRGINDGNDYNDVDDTFTYSMEPESMLNSNILGHNN